MRWQAQRGVLKPAGCVARRQRRGGGRSTSACCGTAAKRTHSAAASGEPSSPAVEALAEFIASPTAGPGTELTTPASWLPTWSTGTRLKQRPRRSVLHERRAGARAYAHALVGAPRLAWGGSLPSPAARRPRSGWRERSFTAPGAPGSLPARADVDTTSPTSSWFGRMLDYAVILPRLQLLYMVRRRARRTRPARAGARRQPDLRLALEQRHVWRSPACRSPPGSSNGLHGVDA